MMVQIQHNVSLKPFNTFGIEVQTSAFTSIKTVSDLRELIHAGTLQSSHMFLGGGSNVLFTKDFNGLVIKNECKGIYITKEDNRHIWITAGSGEVWHDLVMFTVTRGLGGIENMSLIPGTVGAAPMQNIGAYGVELTNVFEQLTAIDLLTGEEVLFNHEMCAFGYRESVFKHQLKGKYFIADVTLRLSKYPELQINYGAIKQVLAERGIVEPTIKDISDAVIYIRQSKLPNPVVLGNAGSFFKNPEIAVEQYDELKQLYPTIPGYPTTPNKIKVPAGWLIEQCGWKGKIVGHTGAHKDQALVLVNYGGASGNEILALSKEIQQSILAKFNIAISPEVNII
ncbi:MAG TPA: UDP-N-acetylmuramate dehydrogenase [Chitinophagales bacterium]|nr:UDP-N-acetylmuramate dehydrogenase [Chitinophagales bacterium]HMZ87886.1 UDP-N-acetylmuramate dehydrogenase [Chitinophagales bacterium]HNJ88387.1 UDP-N-acetylmuramate dehydrogenase [Chitinophagales bacterium]HNK97550.1 UDP-N-acetylmuramate dehydrogenase [Chitinophagales bacterium]HNM08583.1 UDP-N-acetylmuramate dehydrogenase [Chitinophagales bacterium]